MDEDGPLERRGCLQNRQGLFWLGWRGKTHEQVHMTKKVLCLLVNGFEEIETVVPIDLLRRAGIEVTLASLTGQIAVTGRCQMTLMADTLLESINASQYDLLFIPGGPGVKTLRNDTRPAQLAGSFVAAGKPVAAICAAPLVLHDAGLLKGRRFTAHFSTDNELPQALKNERVVVDGPIMTSRGAGTAIDFGLALVQHLAGAPAGESTAKAIML